MKRVLVCALDWGLGHATRCIPVVRELQHQGAEVFLASSGDAGLLLRREFPGLSYHELPGYRPRYQRRGGMVATLAAQMPKFLHTIRLEREEVEALVRNLRLDVVISDNRYGCYSEQACSVFITHQLRVRMPGGWSILEPVVNRQLHLYINRYNKVWVPDAHGSGLTDFFMDRTSSFTYIGWLSRFQSSPASPASADLLVLLSGPEPQRSIFENIIRGQASGFKGRILLVAGQPFRADHAVTGNLEVVSHLDTEILERQIAGARWVVARSGYSTIMDLIRLGKKAAFIPTPGQPEQMLLARYLEQKGIAFCCDQKNFVLDKVRKEIDRYAGLGSLTSPMDLLKKEITTLLS